MRNTKSKGSWEEASGWYKNIVGDRGHYYHQRVVLPGVVRLLDLQRNDRILDLACGNGVLEKYIGTNNYYLGVDVSESLINEAQRLDRKENVNKSANRNKRYMVADVTKVKEYADSKFDKAALVLAIQNIFDPEKAFWTAAANLKTAGKLVVVMNHPCFRIPRQSSWGVDEKNKQQYRRVNTYMTAQKIPINIHPGQKIGLLQTWDYYFPLSDYSKWAYKAGFFIELIEEWTSDKESVGKNARMENRSRQEIPLFMALRFIKK